MFRSHMENHYSHRAGWLRAAVLGANDGLVSTASLIVGVAAASASETAILTAGAAGLMAGALSMAAGEYVSVSSQADSEAADLAKEKKELIEQPELELEELKQTFVKRGVREDTALEVAKQLTAKDALGAHAREELGISEITNARPLQAAFVSAITFAVGAALPLLVVIISSAELLLYTVSVSALFFLAMLGYLGAKTGGANATKASIRVTFWGAIAMGITAIVGSMIGANI